MRLRLRLRRRDPRDDCPPPRGITPAARGKTVIPIDYDIVDGFTNATPDPWILTHVYEPRRIYGTYM